MAAGKGVAVLTEEHSFSKSRYRKGGGAQFEKGKGSALPAPDGINVH